MKPLKDIVVAGNLVFERHSVLSAEDGDDATHEEWALYLRHPLYALEGREKRFRGHFYLHSTNDKAWVITGWRPHADHAAFNKAFAGSKEAARMVGFLLAKQHFLSQGSEDEKVMVG